MDMKMKNYEIGSFFYYSEEDIKDFLLRGDKLLSSDKEKYFISGRQAIRYCLDHVGENKKVLIPAFLCHTVVDPFLEKGYKIYLYNPDKDLSIKVSKINELVRKYEIDLVLLLPYFGFNTIIEDEKFCDAIYILDKTQYFYSDHNFFNVDYEVASIRKWGNSFDGGIAISKKIDFNIEIEEDPSKILLEKAIKSSINKYNYLYKDMGDKASFYDEYKQFNTFLAIQKKYTKMSDLSKSIYTNLDVESIKEKRRKNYRHLASLLTKLNDIKVIFKECKDGEVPLYLPIYIDSKIREKFQKFMIGKNIYLPIIWPKPEKILDKIEKNVLDIYEEIICIPIDQRYDILDMEYIYNNIKEFIRKSDVRKK